MELSYRFLILLCPTTLFKQLRRPLLSEFKHRRCYCLRHLGFNTLVPLPKEPLFGLLQHSIFKLGFSLLLLDLNRCIINALSDFAPGKVPFHRRDNFIDSVHVFIEIVALLKLGYCNFP